MAKGLDANQDMTDWAGQLVQEGFGFVGRYINHGKSQPLTTSEAQHLSTEGLYLVSIYEKGSPTEAAYFTIQRGAQDGNAAVQAAKATGQPTGTPIYFAVDYDADRCDLNTICDYFKNVFTTVRGAGYFVGVYGSGMVCKTLTEQGWVHYTWLAQSRGWAGYDDWHDSASIVQGAETTWHGIDVDLDTSSGDAGGWQVAS